MNLLKETGIILLLELLALVVNNTVMNIML